MIRSMTGYGDAERDTPLGRLRLEVKTVNHRFFNSSVKTPPGFDRYERVVVDALKGHLSRGHISAFLTLDRSAIETSDAPRVDLDRARQIRQAIEYLQNELHLPGSVDLEMMTRFTEVFRAVEPDRGKVEVDPDEVRVLTEQAAEAVRTMREAEGTRLHADLAERLAAMSAQLDRVEAQAPIRLVTERDRLRAAVIELSEQVGTDEDRLAREIAYLADKWDVNEELVRFRSHIELFQEALDADGSEPVGKRLSFLAQEMHREANTIGSKANDAVISQAAVSIKEEIERLREQVENVE